MVRTRNMGAGNADVLPSRDYRRIAVEREVDESEESDYMPVRKQRKMCADGKDRERRRTTPKNSFRNALDFDSEGDLDIGSRTRYQRKLAIVDDDGDAMDSKVGGASLSNGFDSGIRRSTRQRKSTYDSLNQTWLLSCAQMRDYPIYVDVEVPSGSATSQKPKKETEDELSSNAENFEDMYTRVKRARNSSKKRKFYDLDDDNADRSPNSSNCEELNDDDDADEEVVDGSVSNMEDECELAEESSEAETHDEDSRGTKYYLRQKKPSIDRFQVAIEPQRQRKPPLPSRDHVSPRRLRSSNYRASFRSPVAHRSPHHDRYRHATHNSSASSSSSCSSSSEEDRDERRFERRKSKSMARARNRCLPMNLTSKDVTASSVIRDRKKIGSSLADVDPMSVDRTATFESVGGHDHHVQSLKEMLLLPLMYPEVFEKFKITPPRGVLFYGPPGTGKTLVARALANECSQGERKVAFFMRKGADCLSKWVGESERQLRLLFDQAYSMRPSIIFFDEIDGLAPVRSTRQDQIHSSIVSTLLALMDGLDGRGEVVVVGATNRIDAIDPALRRPGRFDREFNFALPSVESRLTILGIHTRGWIPPLSDSFLGELADKTVGYCGADLKALCAESAFQALRRRYPQIYQSKQKLQLDISSIKIEAIDFCRALDGLVPASQRSASAPGRPLNPIVRPLLLVTLNRVLEALKTTFPQGFPARTSSGIVQTNDFADDPSSDEDNNEVFTATAAFSGMPPNGVTLNSGHILNAPGVPQTYTRSNRNSLWYLPSHRPRMLLAGFKGQGQSTHIAPAILHHLERFPTHKLDLPALFATTAKAPEESVSQIFLEAQRNLPAILYLPHVGQWWDTLTDTVRATFMTLLNDLETTSPLLLLATSDCPFDDLVPQIQELFDPHQGEVITMTNPSNSERWHFFSDLILYEVKRKPKCRRKRPRKTESLPLAPPPEPRQLSEKEIRKLREEEEGTLTELRLFLRDILYKLARDRRFSIFTKPVDTSEVTDYLQVIREPMDLETMMSKIDLHKYETVSDFLDDIKLIRQNALEYNPDRAPSDKIIRHRACALRDTAHSYIFTELDPEFDQMCISIREARKQRGESPSKFAPSHYRTLPRFSNVDLDETSQVKNSVHTEDLISKDEADPASSADADAASDDTAELPKEKSTVKKTPPFTPGIKELSVALSPPLASSSVKHRPRRRSVIWFGQQKRIKKLNRIESCSEDSHDNGSHPRTKANHQLVNGRVKSSSAAVKNAADESACDTTMLASVSMTDDLCTIENGNDEMTTLEEPPPLEEPRTTSLCLDLPVRNNHHADSVSTSFDSGVGLSMSTSSIKSKSPATVVDDSNLKESVPEDRDGGDIGNFTAPVEADKSHGSKLPEDRIAEETQDDEDHEIEGSKRTVLVDQARLRHLLDKVVTVTKDVDVEILQKLHCRLHQIVRSNHQEWDKTILLNDMEKEVERFYSHTAC